MFSMFKYIQGTDSNGKTMQTLDQWKRQETPLITAPVCHFPTTFELLERNASSIFVVFIF